MNYIVSIATLPNDPFFTVSRLLRSTIAFPQETTIATYDGVRDYRRYMQELISRGEGKGFLGILLFGTPYTNMVLADLEDFRERNKNAPCFMIIEGLVSQAYQRRLQAAQVATIYIDSASHGAEQELHKSIQEWVAEMMRRDSKSNPVGNLLIGAFLLGTLAFIVSENGDQRRKSNIAQLGALKSKASKPKVTGANKKKAPTTVSKTGKATSGRSTPEKKLGRTAASKTTSKTTRKATSKRTPPKR